MRALSKYSDFETELRQHFVDEHPEFFSVEDILKQAAKLQATHKLDTRTYVSETLNVCKYFGKKTNIGQELMS